MRSLCVRIAESKRFENGLLVVIAYSCVLLGCETPLRPGQPRLIADWVRMRWPARATARGVLLCATHTRTHGCRCSYFVLILAHTNCAIQVFVWSDSLFLVAFSLEFVVKVLGYGFFSHQYIGDSWNLPDFVILITMYYSRLLESAGSDLRAARILRILRPLRLIKRNQGMRVILMSISQCVRSVANVLALWIGLLLVYGILGVNLFMGKFRYCNDDSVYGELDCVGSMAQACTDGSCGDNGGGGGAASVARAWTNAVSNFDNIGSAVVTLFEVSSLEGWIDVMHSAMAAGGPGRQPVPDSNPLASLYFVLFICFGTFVVINLLVGVFVDAFYQAKGIGLLTEEQRNWYDMKRMLIQKHPKVARETLNYTPERLSLQDFVQSSTFKNWILVLVSLNILMLMSQSEGMTSEWKSWSDLFSVAFVCIYLGEIALRVTAFGREFFKRGWNIFDFTIVGFSTLEIVLWAGWVPAPLHAGARALARMFRPLRAIRLLQSTPGLRQLLRTFFFSLPAIVNVASLLLLYFFIYAVLGMQLFGTLKHGAVVNDDANFEHFGNALSLVFRMSTGEDWQAVMHEAQVEASSGGCTVCPADYAVHAVRLGAGPQVETCVAFAGAAAGGNCGDYATALVYFTSFYFLGVYCLMSLFTAVILDCFSIVCHQMDGALGDHHISQFKKMWSEFDPEGTGFIALYRLKDLISALGPPLGFDTERERTGWRLLQAQFSATAAEQRNRGLAEAADKNVGFVQLLEQLAVMRYGRGALEYSERVRVEALQDRLAEEHAAEKIGAMIKGWKLRRDMPENTAILDARSTLNRAISDINEAKRQSRRAESHCSQPARSEPAQARWLRRGSLVGNMVGAVADSILHHHQKEDSALSSTPNAVVELAVCDDDV